MKTGGVYGDLDHCPKEDLLESAQALFHLLPHVKGHKVWGLAKAFDADCYILTSGHQFKAPDVEVEADIYRGTANMPSSEKERTVRLRVLGGTQRDTYWHNCWYEPLVGSVRDGQVVSETDGVEDVTATYRAAHERRTRKRGYTQPAEIPKQTKLGM